MPTYQPGLLDNHQGSPPVEASGKPGHCESSGIGRTLRFDVALLIQVFPQEEVFGSENNSGVYTKAKVAHNVDQERQFRGV
jgi:hypothetical protein